MNSDERQPAESLIEPLSRREREILALLAQEYAAAEIAQRLTLAVSSVKWYLRQLYGKLGVNSKRQAIARARELGLLQIPVAAELGLMPPATVPATSPTLERKHNLPFQLTSFIGREKEIAQIKRRFTASRLVTLTGSGGIGKTRLAIQAARELLPQFPDGVWLVELAPLADPALVSQTICTVLDVKPQGNIPPLVALTDYGREKTLLLVLDNCEHLIDVCAQLAEHLLTHCSDVCLLASSREALGIEGEAAVRVPSLSLPNMTQPSFEILQKSEAVCLFVERATAALPGFALRDANASAIAQLCRRLDGIALAIELAASRVKTLTVEQIAARLDDAFHLLTGGSRTALPRQQTLRATIDWSYSLLSDAERVLLRRVAVFAGGWTLEAAEQVTSDERRVIDNDDTRHLTLDTADILDHLTHLADKSLVVIERKPGTEARYFLLETTRQYAREKLLESGETAALRLRHAEYYRTLVETKWLADEDVWNDEYRVEIDNLRAALTWCNSTPGRAELGLRLAVGLNFESSAMEDGELCGWLESVLTHAEAERVDYPRAMAPVLGVMGILLGVKLSSDLVTARVRLNQSLKLYKALGDRRTSALVYYWLGIVERELGEAVMARLHLEEHLTFFREIGVPSGIAEALFALGEVAVMQEEALQATALIEEGLALKRRLMDRNGVGWGLHHLGHAAQLQGDYEWARQLQEEGLALLREIEQPEYVGVAWTTCSLGEATLACGDPALATVHFRKSLTLSQHLQAPKFQIWCLAGLAGVAAVNKEPARAAKLWGAAAALRQAMRLRPASATRVRHERLQAEARSQLGETAFNAAWAEGQKLTLEQAVEYALTDPNLQE